MSEANNTITAQAPFTITSASGITKKITENLSLDVSTCEPGQYEVMFDFDTSSLFLFSPPVHTGKKFPENAQTGDILFDISCAPYSTRKLLDDGTVKIECALIGLYDCVSGGGANSLSTYAYNENEINKPASSYLTQSQVTNCVLESPRKINVEINSDGQLVLKAGSVVVYPDSATKTFKEYTTTRDYVSTGFNNRQQTLLLNMQGGEESWGTLDGIAAELYCSSTTPVISGQYAVWLNLETFETKYTNNSGSSWQSIRYSMPFVIATCSASAYTSIDSVLDNFTFFGTYLMVRDDVKVLAPSGRNQDGTLNNKLITSVMSGHNYNFNGTTDAHLLLGNEDNSDNGGVICAAYYDYSYNNEKNTIQLIDTEYTCALCGEMKIVNSRITYLKEDEAIKLLNIQQVTHAGMPSNSVQVLSWPSSGSVFTAPADGYYHARGYSQTSAWTSLSLDNIEGKLGSQEVVAGIAGSGLSVYLPAAKGQRVSLHYENLGDWPTNNVYREFRFIPTKGAAGEV